MKPIYTAAALLATATGAHAGNISPPYIEPPVMAPAFSWTGPYAGVSAGTTRTEETRKTWGERVAGAGDPYNKGQLVADIQDAGTCDMFDQGKNEIFTFGSGDSWEYSMPCSDLLNASDEWRNSTASLEGGLPHELGDVESYQTGRETYRQSHATYGVFAGYRHQFGSGVVLGGEVAGHHFDGGTSFEAKAQAGYAISRALPYITAGFSDGPSRTIYGVGLDYAITQRWIAGVEYIKGDNLDRITARIAYKF